MSLGYGLISCQRVAGDPRSWEQLYAEALDLAALADRLGYSQVWTTEHHFVDDGYMPSLLPMSAAIAARTTDIEVGTGVLLAPLHHPLRLAEDAATVQVISDGRLLLGLGLGWSPVEFSAFGADLATRGKAMTEMFSILRQAWSGEPINHDGSVYEIDPVAVRPTPAKDIPIVIGGNADAALRRAGRLADGFFSNAPRDKLRHQVDVITQALTAAGRDPASFRWQYYSYVFPCDNAEAGWAEILPSLWASRWKYSDMGASASRSGGPAEVPPLPADQEEQLRDLAVVGTGDDIASTFVELRDALGVPLEFSVRAYYPEMPFSQQAEIMERLATEVMPLL